MKSHLSSLCLLVVSAVTGWANDWPQWQGPNRDGKSAETGLMQQWPEGGPKLRWTAKEVGLGYGSPSVVGDRMYLLGADDNGSFVQCLDVSTGNERWQTPLGNSATETNYLTKWGGGPRSSVTVDGDRLYVLSDLGDLACLSAADGKEIWKVNFVERYGATIPKWGYAESPLVDGARVVCQPGGKAYLAAFDKMTGAELLTCSELDDPVHYVSIIKHKVAAVDMYITSSRFGLRGFDAATGKLLWKNDDTGNPTAVIPTPVALGNRIYHSSNYNVGSVLVELTANGQGVAAEKVWFSKEMQNHHGGYIHLDNVIYGYSKGKGFMCQDLATGEPKWIERDPGRNSSASVIFADGRLYYYGDNEGKCLLVKPSQEGLDIVSEFAIPEQTKFPRGSGKVWTHPVIANGTLYLRDQELLFAFDIRD